MIHRYPFLIISLLSITFLSFHAHEAQAGFEWVPPPADYSPPPSYIPPQPYTPQNDSQPLSNEPVPVETVPSVEQQQTPTKQVVEKPISVPAFNTSLPAQEPLTFEPGAPVPGFVPPVPTGMTQRPDLYPRYSTGEVLQENPWENSPVTTPKPVIDTPPVAVAATKSVPPPTQEKANKLVINPFPLGQETNTTSIGQTAIATAQSFDIAQGFGSDMPLALAISQIVPAEYSYVFRGTIRMGQRVSWNGGRSWNLVLEEMLNPIGLHADISGKTVTIQSKTS